MKAGKLSSPGRFKSLKKRLNAQKAARRRERIISREEAKQVDWAKAVKTS